MSRLLENSEQYRDPLIAKNIYQNTDEYNAGNSRALSDSDVHGKGETNTIGSSDDIQKRNQLISKNKYQAGKEYNISRA
ncbi:MAG: hypothetical protein ACOC33_01215 [bacterium]